MEAFDLNIENILKEYNSIVEEKILSFFPEKDVSYQILIDAMKYSLMAGGKRVRPVLCMEFCKASGGNYEDALEFAAAIEMLHTYSLIHDDLPAIDNDELRRGKPTNHVVYGEGNALIAGDALQTAAFGMLLSSKCTPDLIVKAGKTLAYAAGKDGMCAGQILDMDTPNKSLELEDLYEIHENKTSALLETSCMMGVIAANGSDEKIEAARQFAKALGLAFQVRDDMLDVISTEEKLGKPIGSDEKNQKTTFVTKLGLEKCQKIVEEETNKALKCLVENFENTDFLVEFTKWLAGRDY